MSRVAKRSAGGAIKIDEPRGRQDESPPLPGWLPPSSASLSRTLHQDLNGCMR